MACVTPTEAVERTGSVSDPDPAALRSLAIPEDSEIDSLEGCQRNGLDNRRGYDGQQQENESGEEQDGQRCRRPQHCRRESRTFHPGTPAVVRVQKRQITSTLSFTGLGKNGSYHNSN